MSKNTSKITDSELESRFEELLWVLNNGFNLEETNLAVVSVSSHKSREIMAEKFDEYLERQRKINKTFPFCQDDTCCSLLEKKYKKDEMDKNHWYWCEVHGWIHSFQVLWLTHLQNEQRK